MAAGNNNETANFVLHDDFELIVRMANENDGKFGVNIHAVGDQSYQHGYHAFDTNAAQERFVNEVIDYYKAIQEIDQVVRKYGTDWNSYVCHFGPNITNHLRNLMRELADDSQEFHDEGQRGAGPHLPLYLDVRTRLVDILGEGDANHA